MVSRQGKAFLGFCLLGFVLRLAFPSERQSGRSLDVWSLPMKSSLELELVRRKLGYSAVSGFPRSE